MQNLGTEETKSTLLWVTIEPKLTKLTDFGPEYFQTS
jgi:hypothetical protein